MLLSGIQGSRLDSRLRGNDKMLIKTALIHHPILIILFLLTIETAVLYLAQQKRCKKYFTFLPAVFWIYFLPMLASTARLIDSQSPVYSVITKNLLPASLFLLLIGIDIKAIARLGKPALIMFFAGSAGIVLGAPIVFGIFQYWIGDDFWAGFGALSGSWTGGSANMIAVKEALGTPDSVFLPMVVVDTIVPYVWMGFLVAMAAAQPLYDRWNRSDRRILDQLSRKVKGLSAAEVKLRWPLTTLIFVCAILANLLAQGIARLCPVIKDVISPYAWTIIVISTLGIGLSFTPARKLENFGSQRIGYFVLYFVLTTIGAKANLSNIGSTVILIMAGFMLAVFHSGVTVLVSRLIKAPMFLVAVASQANIGGVASAPIVAEIYQPGLASVGLLLAILGNIVGTYLGILAGQLCRFVSNF